MTLIIRPVIVPISEEPQDILLKRKICELLKIDSEDIRDLTVLKRSLDARKKSFIHYLYEVSATFCDEAALIKRNPDLIKMSVFKESPNPLSGVSKKIHSSRTSLAPIIIGSGPAGIFAAWLLAEAGVSPIVIERGESVEERRKSTQEFCQKGLFNPESNFCFGEGGAGTFSDGKLLTGKKHPWIPYLYERWVFFGAPKEILFEARPHIGSDYLVNIVKNMRMALIERGTTFLFKKKFLDFEYSPKSPRYNIKLSDGTSLETNHLVLAIGHSARDTLEMLSRNGVGMTSKAFAVGLRVEYPQDLINEIQFGKKALEKSKKTLPSADYKLTARVGERGVWSFCMCPGGYVLPTASQEGLLSVNGMSLCKRDSGFANAALIVNISKRDFGDESPFGGMKYQMHLENTAFRAGGSSWNAPAERLTDFLKEKSKRFSKKVSDKLLASTYRPGVVPYPLETLFSEPIAQALKAAMILFDKKMRGFISQDAMLIGVETKTSSPVTIVRGENMQSETHPGLYPAGEGAGYAGGIVSAALDGLEVARKILETL